jgi:hypothetical protein
MNLRLVLAVTAVLGSIPVIVAQRGLQTEPGAVSPALQCMVGVGRAAAPAAGSPVREIRLIGAAANGNLVCLRS